MTSQTVYHDPVMLEESISALNIKSDGIYVDATYGGGGHSAAILERLKKGTLISFDQDQDSADLAKENENLIFINQNFKYISNFLNFYGFEQVDGILADLGISSHHIDTSDRGFAFRTDGPLDMRMNRNQDRTAEDVLNEYPEEDLKRIFREYGELDNPGKIASQIVQTRQSGRIKSTRQLLECLESLTPGKFRNKFLAKVFQALRIEVNGELDSLKSLLMHSASVVKKDGILAVITYHSLEDRLVKNFIKTGNFSGVPDKDLFGRVSKPFESINRKPLYPSPTEIERNNRARSAKLRVAKRTRDHG